MKTYSEKLSDPRWQKRRLDILQRDNFSCQYCYSKDKKLNVHHRYYVSKRDPWIYPSWALVSICDDCHQSYHSYSMNYFYNFEDFIDSLSGGNYTDDFANNIRILIESNSDYHKIETFKKILEGNKNED